jgi:DMSO/TMAO reductase YedYZ molybdopterin-dependent catalytic subunit
MGCARWKGVRLKDILDKAGLKSEAIEIEFNGADSGVSDKTPDFVKSIPAWKAIEDTTIVAYEMNGAPLPHFNGFPARVIVPGWTATYWMKHVTSISALTKPERSFWMAGAYRIPLGKFPIVAHFATQETEANTPITEMVINSLIASHAEGASVRAGAPVSVGGIAGTPATASAWSRCRATAARPGPQRRSARTSAASPSAAGTSTSRRRPASSRSPCAPATRSARRKPPS